MISKDLEIIFIIDLRAILAFLFIKTIIYIEK